MSCLSRFTILSPSSSQRIGFTNTTSTLDFTAFARPDNKTAFVIMNAGQKAESFQVRVKDGFDS